MRFILPLVLVLATAASAAPPPDFAPGTTAPDLVLPSLADGTPMSLSDFRGKKVVLHVFASW